MAFTNIAAVANMYPTWQRGVPNQKPSDGVVKQFINDVADIIIAILERRFNESILGVGSLSQWLVSLGLPNKNWQPNLNVSIGDIILDENDPMSAQQAQNNGTTGANSAVLSSTFGVSSTDGTVVWLNVGQSRQLGVLERGNRYGAASQLGAVFAGFSVASALNLAKEYTKADWIPFKCELNAETEKGEPKDYGTFDVLFDPLANVQTPRPLLSGIAGGDRIVGEAADREGVSSVFSKFGVDFGRQTRRWPGPGNVQ